MICPKCRTPFPTPFITDFSEEERKEGGKEIQCRHCKRLMWISTDGQIKPPLVLLAGREPLWPKRSVRIPWDLHRVGHALLRLGRALGLA